MIMALAGRRVDPAEAKESGFPAEYRERAHAGSRGSHREGATDLVSSAGGSRKP